MKTEKEIKKLEAEADKHGLYYDRKRNVFLNDYEMEIDVAADNTPDFEGGYWHAGQK